MDKLHYFNNEFHKLVYTPKENSCKDCSIGRKDCGIGILKTNITTASEICESNKIFTFASNDECIDHMIDVVNDLNGKLHEAKMILNNYENK